MKTLIFDFNDLSSKDKAARKAVQQFHRAGVSVAQSDVSNGVKRTSGISYRELSLTFADSQRVVFRIKQSGDIYQVVLNGQLLPIRNQEDHVAAIAEIAKAMDAGRAKFQKKLAAIKVKPPAGIRTAAPKMEQVLTEKRDTLKSAIADVRSEIEKVRGTAMDSATLDAAAKGGFMAFNVDSASKFTVYVKFEAGMSEKDARRDAMEATRAELGGGATRVLEGGSRVSKVPSEAWEADKAKGWAWFAKGHLNGASA